MNHMTLPPTIQFEWDTIKEDDCSWNVLFVKINDGPWLVAQEHFSTENTDEIEQQIRENFTKVYDPPQ